MKITHRICFFLITLLLTSCATPYQPVGYSGGFTERQISDTSFEIKFSGNGYTSSERAGELSLMRAAEITLECGYNHFVLSNDLQSMSSSTSISTTNTFMTSTGFTSVTTGIPVNKPSNYIVIQIFKNKPEGFVSYDARIVMANLKEKYNIEPQKMRFGAYFSDKLPIYLTANRGVHVTRVVVGSAFDKAGIARDDIILSLNGRDIVENSTDISLSGEPTHIAKQTATTVLKNRLAALPKETESLELTVLRKDQIENINVSLK